MCRSGSTNSAFSIFNMVVIKSNMKKEYFLMVIVAVFALLAVYFAHKKPVETRPNFTIALPKEKDFINPPKQDVYCTTHVCKD